MTRYRERTSFFPTDGFLKWEFFGNVSTYPSSIARESWDQCTDDLGRHRDNPLSIHHTKKLLSPLNGVNGGPLNRRTFQNYVPGAYANALSHLATSLPSIGESATTLLARTNPGRAQISVLNFVYELKDIPGMLRDIGAFKLGRKRPRTARDFSNLYLSYQMGWRPLISDIIKLITFAQQVNQRVNELERLYAKGGLKRRLSLGKDIKEETTNVFLSTEASLITSAKVVTTTTSQRSGTVRWIPTDPPSSLPDSKSILKQARAQVFGLNLQPAYLWNAIPWTWLVDWAGNTNEYLVAHGNTVPCEPTGINIMTRTFTRSIWTRSDTHSWVSGGTGLTELDSKERAQSSGSLSAHLPFLSGRQLSILGALAIQRFR